MKKVLSIMLLCILFVQCDYRDVPINIHKLGYYTAYDCRAFQGTPAWELAKAVDDNDTSEIIKILKEDPKIIDFQEPLWGNTVLMQSINKRRYTAFMTLLRLGADVTVHTIYNGASAIHMAVETGDTIFVEALLRYGANINDFGKGGRKDVWQVNWTYSPLFDAVSNASYGDKDMTMVKYLIEHGADLNMCFSYGSTALNDALILENYDLAIYLIESGANYTIPIYRLKEYEEGWFPVSIQQYVDECKGIIPPPTKNYVQNEMSDSQYNRLTELISQPYVPKPIVSRPIVK